MNNKAEVKAVIANLCIQQKRYIMQWPKRENITQYDEKLDIGKNEDFAIWEMELTK